MEFSEIQKKALETADNYSKNFEVTIDEDFALLKLYEEVGELAQAVLIHRKMSRPEKHMPADQSKEAVAMELADVVGMAIVNANLLGIDLEQALKDKWIDREKK